MDFGFDSQGLPKDRSWPKLPGTQRISETVDSNNNLHHPGEETRPRVVRQFAQGQSSWTKPKLTHLSKFCYFWNVTHSSLTLNRAPWTQCNLFSYWFQEWAFLCVNIATVLTVGTRRAYPTHRMAPDCCFIVNSSCRLGTGFGSSYLSDLLTFHCVFRIVISPS